MIFDWDADGLADHVGMVESVEADGTVWTYEGNRNDVLDHVHRDPGVILAYCHPPYDGGPPGVFGRNTDHAVRRYQAEKSLEVDGVVGPISWTSLWVSPIT